MTPKRSRGRPRVEKPPPKRPETLGGSVRYSVHVAPDQAEKLKRIRVAKNLPSIPATFRQLIDDAAG